MAISGASGPLTSRAPRRRLDRVISREGIRGVAVRILRRLVRPVYERVDLVFIDLDLARWAARLSGRAVGVPLEEVTPETLPRLRQALEEGDRRLLEEQLALGSRLFLAVRDGRAAAIVGLSRRHSYPPWQLTYEVGPRETILFHIEVKREFRRGAIGGVLAEHVFATLREEGFSRVVGVIHSRNRRSLILAENLGLRQFEKRRHHRFFSRWRSRPVVVEGRSDSLTGRERMTQRYRTPDEPVRRSHG